MSADNWRICPKCRKAALAEKDRLIEEAAKAYGKVPAQEWSVLTAKSHEPIPCNESLREDYEIGTNSSGEFYVSYGCSCDDCGFKYSFDRKENALIRKEGA